ncbi:type 1 glutamine amidotransferase [Pseudaestuariivita atlantica]|uniref:type 1 glutamine amidotransferase n=1 Tax=Pseudaestuariivita atlantica TaxID=1317121 RepID=UPI00067C1F85|nr:type 1 glutamine amidotransferase [Pseudaestuariivita atlantica]
MQRIRLGLLQVNHDRTEEIGDHYPDDSHRFRDLFDQLEQRFTYRVYMTEGGELPESPMEQDAFLITGSPLSAMDDHPWMAGLMDFIRACDATRTPLLGCCFGHQAIARALGGTLAKRNGGYNVGVETTHFTRQRPWMDGPEQVPMYVFHEDHVVTLPSGCDLLGGSNACPIGSFAKGNHIFTTQAHPEIDHRFMEAVMRHVEGHGEDLSSGWATMDQEPQGVVFAGWAAEFFKGGRHAQSG